MRKNSPKEEPQRLRASVVRGVLALLVVGLLVAPIAVQAELKATQLAYTWDYTAPEWEWGHATVYFGSGEWIPLLHEVYFDKLERLPGELEPTVCGANLSDPPPDPLLTTPWAGWIEYGLPLTDTLPVDARGFQGSDGWVLMNCDLNEDTYWDREDLTVAPDKLPEPLVSCTEGVDWANPTPCMIQYQDEKQECPPATAEHCTYDLSTMLIISLDTNCDGEIDEEAAPLFDALDTTGLCVHFWAQAPDYEEGDEVWSFPLPVRITDADGAKTLMLYPLPTAVDLASFSAEPQGEMVIVTWETASERDNLGFNLYRANASGGERIRLNDRMIFSESPGSTVGSRYQFVDRSAEPGATYHYWLEDIDLSGAGTMNGPVAVQVPPVRRLPCRPRPAPISGQWE